MIPIGWFMQWKMPRLSWLRAGITMTNGSRKCEIADFGYSYGYCYGFECTNRILEAKINGWQD